MYLNTDVTGRFDTEKILKRVMSVTGAKNERELSEITGMQQAAINAAKQRNAPPYRLMVKIASQYNKSLDWLMWGEESSGSFVSVPLFEARLSAGGGSLETSASAMKQYAFRSEWLSARGEASKMALMRVSGDSMEPKIHNGDMVLIDLSQTDCRAGQIYAVAIEDLIYLKRIDTAPGEIILKSENQQFEPIRVPASGDNSERVRIIGKCIWLCREI